MHKISDVVSRLIKLDIDNYDEINHLSKYAIRILVAYEPKSENENRKLLLLLSNIVKSHKDNISRGRKLYTEAKSNLNHYLRDLHYIEVESVSGKIDSIYLDNTDL